MLVAVRRGGPAMLMKLFVTLGLLTVGAGVAVNARDVRRYLRLRSL